MQCWPREPHCVLLFLFFCLVNLQMSSSAIELRATRRFEYDQFVLNLYGKLLFFSTYYFGSDTHNGTKLYGWLSMSFQQFLVHSAL